MIILPSLQVPLLVTGANIMEMQLARSKMYAIHAMSSGSQLKSDSYAKSWNNSANYQIVSENFHKVKLSESVCKGMVAFLKIPNYSLSLSPKIRIEENCQLQLDYYKEMHASKAKGVVQNEGIDKFPQMVSLYFTVYCSLIALQYLTMKYLIFFWNVVSSCKSTMNAKSSGSL